MTAPPPKTSVLEQICAAVDALCDTDEQLAELAALNTLDQLVRRAALDAKRAAMQRFPASDVAEALGISRQGVYRYAAAGRRGGRAPKTRRAA